MNTKIVELIWKFCKKDLKTCKRLISIKVRLRNENEVDKAIKY